MSRESDLQTRVAWIKKHLRHITLADVFDVRVLGFALTLSWSYVMFFSPTIHFSTRNDITHFNSVFGFSSLGMLVVLLFGAFFSSWFVALIRLRAVRVAWPCLMTLTVVVLTIVEAQIFTQPWCSIASTCAGLGLGMMYLAWGEVYKRLSSLRAILNAASSFLLAALLFAFVVAMPRPAGIVITALIPLVIGYILFKVLDVWNKPALLSSIHVKRAAFSVRAVLSIGVVSFTESIVRALFFNAMPIINEGSYPWLFLVATIISASIICITMLSRESLDYGFTYKSIVFVLGFIFLLLPILDPGTSLADVLALVTYSSVMLMIWIMLSRIAGLYHLAALLVFGVGWGAQVAGTLVGTFGGAFLSSFFEMTPRVLSLISLVSVGLLLFAYLFVFDEKSIIKLANGVSEDDPKHRPFRTRCEEIARRYGLTPRETEVMVLFAKGRSNPRIQEALDLTPGTVNTHMSHIYKKLDVHDKQEFIDLLEGSLEQRK